MSFVWLGNADKLIEEAAKPNVEQVAAFCLATCVDSHRPGFGWDTGALAGSYTVAEAGKGYEVGTSISYANFVEFGTKHMAAQAHLRKAAAQTAATFPGVRYTGGGGL